MERREWEVALTPVTLKNPWGIHGSQRPSRPPRLTMATALMTGLALLGGLLLTCGAPAHAQRRAQPLNMGELRIPLPRGYVNDYAGVLSPEQRAELEELCRRIDRTAGAQVALAVLPDLKGEPITEVRNRLFEAWGVGRSADDRGLLILHALEERRIEVEVGYGLEPILPDAHVGALLDREVVPAFREGRIFEGYRAGIVALGERILQDPDAAPGPDAYRGRSGSRETRTRGFPLGSLLLVPVLLYLLVRHPRLLLLLLLMNMGGRRGHGGGLGGGFGGGFGGFGGGLSGGGGAGRSY
jgi:uncharacterized protein